MNQDPRAFLTTRWTRVRAARVDSDSGRAALAELCAAYYEPVLAYLRAATRDADGARDLAHAFFAALLSGQGLAAASPEHGRFRSYLLGAAKHFLLNQRAAARRLKRGGGAEHLPLEDDALAASGQGRTPEREFDRQWALTLIARALDALRAECAAEGRVDFFERAKPWLTGEAGHGDQTSLASDLGLTPDALKMAIHRLKRRFRARVKDEVSGTLSEPADVDEEMRGLFAALAD